MYANTRQRHQYVCVTHQRIVNELLETSLRDRVVGVVSDSEHKNCVGLRVKELFDAGIAVYVRRMKSYMHHEKIVIVDSKTVVHGSVNFSEHAMASGGLMVILIIHKEWRCVLPVLWYFAAMMKLPNYRPVNLADLNKCVTCSECKKCFMELATDATTSVSECIASDNKDEDHSHVCHAGVLKWL